MGGSSEVVPFTPGDLAPLLARLAEVVQARDGWVNLRPEPDDDEPAGTPVRAGLFGLVSGRGPRLPVGTWVPGADGGRRPEPDSLGLQHSGGPKAARRLVEAGVTPPDGATVLSDHPRRGLVLAIPRGTRPEVFVGWLLTAARVLSPDPLPDTWSAVIHRR